jgi:uncharacterized membrane protein YcaP (DUF421 family)
VEGLFFDGWETIIRTGIVGALAYVVLVLFLRISGNRTLSKMNAFDFIVTVALGSTLATVLLNKDVSLAEGALAFGLLIGLQYLVTWASVHTAWVRPLVTGEPRMLFYQGEFLPVTMRRARVAEAEVFAAVRAAGMSGMTGVEAVVMETDGSLSVVRHQPDSGRSTLAAIQDFRRADKDNP